MIVMLRPFTHTMGEIVLNSRTVGVYIYNPDLLMYYVTLHDNLRLSSDELVAIAQTIKAEEANR